MTSSVRDFVVWAHGTQTYGDNPYVMHLDAVAEIIGSVKGLPPYAVTVAYLHDVLEDTPINKEDLQKWFGKDVTTCVTALTDPDGENRKERKRKLHAHLASLGDSPTDLVTLAVKTADRLANIRASVVGQNQDLLDMYAQEHPDFRSAVFREGLCDEVWSELETLITPKTHSEIAE